MTVDQVIILLLIAVPLGFLIFKVVTFSGDKGGHDSGQGSFGG